MTRRALHWERIKGTKAWTSLTIGTAGGAGLLPIAPGTFGTLVGIPIAWAAADWSVAPRLLFWCVIFAIGTWACAVFDELMGSGDNQNLVIDEVVGFAITSWLVQPESWAQWALAFALFRVFDIAKLPPVRQLDRWSKTVASRGEKKGFWLGGFGVMADDALAGVQGLLVFAALKYFGILQL